MNNIVKFHEEEDADSSSSFSRLPDEIILQILNKLRDLKVLCSCYLVSRRFSSIVLQVDTISFTAPFLNANITDTNNGGNVNGDRFPQKLLRLLMKPLHLLRDMIVASHRPPPSVIIIRESFRSACEFLNKFTEVKSLSIEPAFTSLVAMENHFFFKWKVLFGKGIQSIILLSPNSICDPYGGVEEDIRSITDLSRQKTKILTHYFTDLTMWHKMSMNMVKRLPKLEEISITDSGRRGMLSLNAEDLGVVKEWLRLAPDTVNTEVSQCNIYASVLNLPKSGYVMKEVTGIVMVMGDLLGATEVLNTNDSFIAEGKEEAAYNEAAIVYLATLKGMRERGALGNDLTIVL